MTPTRHKLGKTFLFGLRGQKKVTFIVSVFELPENGTFYRLFGIDGVFTESELDDIERMQGEAVNVASL